MLVIKLSQNTENLPASCIYLGAVARALIFKTFFIFKTRYDSYMMVRNGFDFGS